VKEIFASDDPSGQFTAVAREPSGGVALAYVGNPEQTVRMARISGGVWTNETVDEYDDSGRDSELALDGAGLPHVSYLNKTRHEVWYATRSAAGVWTRRLARVVGDSLGSAPGGATSIAVEPSGRPHLVWYNVLSKSVEHGVWNGSSWDIDTVDPAPSFGASWTSIALDAQGRPRIAYVNGGAGLQYASRNQDGTYAIEPAAPSVREVALVLDGGGSPHVSYYDVQAKSIVYAHRTAPGWATEAIDSSDDTYHANGIRLDASDRAHLCYEKIGSDGYSILVYATNSIGGIWTKNAPPFPKNNPGGSCSIALDSQRQPHIAHSFGLDVVYSHLQAGTWIHVSFDTGLAIGGFSSIALDGNGTPQISYYDLTRHQLRYARQR
jgi:hypothetical protein